VNRWGVKTITIPADKYQKLFEIKQKLGARTWADFVDIVYPMLISQTDACTEKIKKILEVLQT